MAESLAVLGCGNMGEAILRALLRDSAAAPRGVFAFDPNDSRSKALDDLRDLQWSARAADAVARADVVLLAVKPQSMAALLREIAPAANGRLVVSIAAGITTEFIESQLAGARVVRAMPNTPLLVGKGLVALCPGASATGDDPGRARSLFPGATLLDVGEEQMDAVTAVSGSGPAYFYAFVEALAAAAQQQGFDAETAGRLAAGTFIGAAALLESAGTTAAELRRRVTSPGGTTEAALKVFEDRQLDATVRAAVSAAVKRGQELATSPAMPPGGAAPGPTAPPGAPSTKGSARPPRG